MKRFIVWADYGGDGWSPEDCDTFQEAVAIRDGLLRGARTVLVTELIPLVVSDGRLAAKVEPSPAGPATGGATA